LSLVKKDEINGGSRLSQSLGYWDFSWSIVLLYFSYDH